MDDIEPTVLSLSTTSSAGGLSSDISDPPRRYTASPTRKVKKRRKAARRPSLPFFQTARSAVNARISEMTALACSVKEGNSDSGVRQKKTRRPATRASKSGRSCSADDVPARSVVPELLSRHSANKMAEASDTKKSDSSRKVKRRVKGSSSCEGKGEERGEGKADGKADAKSDAKKVSSRSVVRRRSANSAGGGAAAAAVQPVIRVKVSPSGTHKVLGDNEAFITDLSNAWGEVLIRSEQTLRRRTPRHVAVRDSFERLVAAAAAAAAEGSVASQDAAARRRVARRKVKGKTGDSESATEASVGTGAGAGTPAAVAAAAATLLRASAAPAALATTAAVTSRTSPLHCAFLNALKECSPRLIAALSATNEAAFLNAMWSCFWRGYRAGFQASVRELEASSGLSVTSNPAAAAAATAALEAAPKGHSEKKRHPVRAAPEVSDYSSKI